MATKVHNAKVKSGKMFTLSPDKLHELAVKQIRFGVSDARVAELASEISIDKGQIDPGMINKQASGKSLLIAGNTRLRAIMLINEDPDKWGFTHKLGFDVVLQTLTSEEETIAALRSNSGGILRTMDLAKVVKDLSGYRTTQEISDALTSAGRKVSKAKVVYLLHIFNELSPHVHELLHTDHINESGARNMLELAKAAELDSPVLDELANGLAEKENFETFLTIVRKQKIMKPQAFGSLAEKVFNAGHELSTITPKAILEIAKGKRKQSEPTRTIDEWVELMGIIKTSASALCAEYFQGTMDDGDIIRTFRNLKEEV